MRKENLKVPDNPQHVCQTISKIHYNIEHTISILKHNLYLKILTIVGYFKVSKCNRDNIKTPTA